MLLVAVRDRRCLAQRLSAGKLTLRCSACEACSHCVVVPRKLQLSWRGYPAGRSPRRCGRSGQNRRRSRKLEFFFYCRDKPGTGALRERGAETHQSFMDTYADAMIARGPTMAEDGVTATGSMHIVDLPDAEAAWVFAYEEPNYKAGVYRSVMVSRWRNALGRTMWEFEGDALANRRFLVIAHGKPTLRDIAEELRDTHSRFLLEGGTREHLIACGPLLSDDGTGWNGTMMLVEYPDRTALESMLEHEPCIRAALYESVEIHDWQFGGRHA